MHLIFGFMGMYLLAKEMKLERFSSYLTSFVFMLSSIFALHLTEGHVEWLAQAFIPWFFLYYMQSFSERKKVFGSIFFLRIDAFYRYICFCGFGGLFFGLLYF